MPAPGTAAAKARRASYYPDTEEARWLKQASMELSLSGHRGRNEYLDELNALADREYRAAYNARQRERRAAGAIAKPKARKSGRIRVRAHWRGIKR